jgi:predicted ATPase
VSIVQSLKQVTNLRRMLLMLDNREHLAQACAELAEDLLGSCPDLQILATSRAPLGTDGEVAWRVPSLDLPDGGLRCWRVASGFVRARSKNECRRSQLVTGGASGW